MGLPFSTFVHPEDLEYVNSTYLKTLQGKKIRKPSDFRIITKSGSVMWFDVKSVRIFWNKKPATQSFFIDITEQKKAEDALRQANQLNMMTSITRHDINNQITMLTGFLRILEKKQPDPTLSEYFQKISTTTKRISPHDPVHQRIREDRCPCPCLAGHSYTCRYSGKGSPARKGYSEK